IEDGHAKLKAGGDATNSSDYEATKTNQNVYIGAPSTIKIASAGDLFQNWDANSVLTENRTNEDSFHKSYNTAIKTLNTQINSLNAQNAKNDLAFQAAAQSAASYASDVQSLAKAMLQGGTFESWAKGQIQDKVNAAMATAIANATGMSPDMASQLVSWFEKKQADKKAKAKARTQEITSGLVTVASIAASFIAGPEMMAVGQAALQAVQGYQNGGMEGALVGAASGAATGYARQFGVNVSVSYSYSGGFGGSVGLGSSSLNAGVSFSQHGSSSFNIGGTYGNVSYNPQSGFSGSVNLTPGQNTGAMVNLGQHSGPSLTIQESDESSGVGGSVTIDGKGNTTVAATYRNATVVSATGNVHNPSSFGNLSVNDNFNSDLNQNLAMGKADENLTAGRAELEAGRNAIAETGNEPQKEILNNENASAADQHGVLATLAKAGEFLTDPSSASTWLGRTTQDVVGSFLGSTGLGASDSNGFIDKNGKYVQRTCFTAGTLIRTKEGLKPIEKIEIGDLVLSLDPKTGELSYKKVSRLFSNETPIVHRITYTNGNVINTTWNHPFFIRGKGFTEVRNIQPEERSVTVASIRNSSRIERSSGIQIGASLASIGSQSTNSNSATWKDEIRGTVGISKIEEVYEKTKVYNFEVEENHTYFVGKDGVLVHNKGGCSVSGLPDKTELLHGGSGSGGGGGFGLWSAIGSAAASGIAGLHELVKSALGEPSTPRDTSVTPDEAAQMRKLGLDPINEGDINKFRISASTGEKGKVGFDIPSPTTLKTIHGQVPLPDKEIPNFKNGKVERFVGMPGETYYGVRDPDSRSVWWVKEKPDSKATWRREAAVKKDWNDGTIIESFTIPKDEGVFGYRGPAAGQVPKTYYYGGKEQIYFPVVPKEWIKKEPMTWPKKQK
ncbi:intein C-terminal splicing domain protein, partial [Leptospira broomii serovar Hurstbridge str. 5399]